MTFTVLGGTGFIGSHLLAGLRSQGMDCFAPGRDDREVFKRELGHVIYCAGLTADFRKRPFDTIDAHVCYVLEILRSARFDSLLYLSSTRVYAGAASTSEDAALTVSSLDPDQIYNLSKLTGEAVCVCSGREHVRVARLSNVYGLDTQSQNFLSLLIRDAVGKGKVLLETALDSAKDYISIDDVVRVLPQIAVSGRERIYNVAAGANVSNALIVGLLRNATGCALEVAAAARLVTFPVIDTRRLKDEFGFIAAGLAELLPALIEHYKGLSPR